MYKVELQLSVSISTNYHSGVVLYMIFHRNIIISCFLHFCEIFLLSSTKWTITNEHMLGVMKVWVAVK